MNKFILIAHLLISFTCLGSRLPDYAVNEINLKKVNCFTFLSNSTYDHESIGDSGYNLNPLLISEPKMSKSINSIYKATTLYPNDLNISTSFEIEKTKISKLARYSENTIFISPKRWFKKYSEIEHIAIVQHELAHALADKLNKIDRSKEWQNIDGGWFYNSIMSVRDDGSIFSGVPKNRKSHVSKRSMANPGEDFAESVSLYRVDPKRLRSISINKYNFIKIHVFNNKEFLNECD